MTSATSAAVMSAGAPPLASSHIFVSTEPGLTQLTRMPCSFTSTASASVSEMTAPLDAQYDTQPEHFSGPITPEIGLITAEGVVLNHGRRVGTAEGRITDAHGRLLVHGTTTCLIFEA